MKEAAFGEYDDDFDKQAKILDLLKETAKREK
jgi:hypothetical protein